MKVEHKLSAAQQETARAIVTDMQQAQRAYYVALGQAMEHNRTFEQGATVLANVVKLIETEAQLPPAQKGFYVLSQDGTAIVAETADAPAAEQQQLAMPPVPGELIEHVGKRGGLVNGSAT